MNKFSELVDGGTPQTQMKKKRTLVAICITAALIAAMLLFLAIFGLASLLAKDKKTDLEAESVVSIGATFKTTISEDKLYSGSLLVLDGNHPYNGNANVIAIESHTNRPTHQVEGNTQNIYTVLDKVNFKATTAAITAFDKMLVQFLKNGDDNIIIANAYDEGSKSVQDPIYSTGEAFELKYYHNYDKKTNPNDKRSLYGASAPYTWIYENAHKYGFVNIGERSSVFRYVGVAHSTAMKQKNLSFEQYIESIKTYTPDAALKVSVSGESYAIYYLAKDSEHILPKDYEYTVSGNNVDGYIITVNLSRPASN